MDGAVRVGWSGHWKASEGFLGRGVPHRAPGGRAATVGLEARGAEETGGADVEGSGPEPVVVVVPISETAYAGSIPGAEDAGREMRLR